MGKTPVARSVFKKMPTAKAKAVAAVKAKAKAKAEGKAKAKAKAAVAAGKRIAKAAAVSKAVAVSAVQTEEEKELLELISEAAQKMDFVEAQRLKTELDKLHAAAAATEPAAEAVAVRKAAPKKRKKAGDEDDDEEEEGNEEEGEAGGEGEGGGAGGEDDDDADEDDDDEEGSGKKAAGKKRKGGKLEKAAGKMKTPSKPVVPELEKDPFFDVPVPELLKPDCPTTCEREALRAVQAGSFQEMRPKLIGRVPLFCLRDLASCTTAMHAAIESGNTVAIATLAREVSHGHAFQSKRRSQLGVASTGEMSVRTLGFATGKIGVARGGREMNNALADQNLSPEPLHSLLGRVDISRDTFQLLNGLQLLSPGGGCDSRGLRDGLEQCVEPAALGGRRQTVSFLLERMAGYPGISKAHLEALGDAPLSAEIQPRSVTSQLGFGGQLCAIHLAAINEDASKLQAMLKLQPSAATLASQPGYSPVHFASVCAGTGPLRVLLTEWSVDRQTPAPGKRLPLHLAAAAGREANVRLLMGGRGTGPGTPPKPLEKEVRELIVRVTESRKEPTAKAGRECIIVLSQLLVEFLFKLINEAHAAGVGGAISVSSLRRAARKVLTGVLAPRQAAPKSAAAKSPAAKSPSKGAKKKGGGGKGLLRKLSDIGEDALEEMFTTIDSNGDGKLEKHEIKEVFTSRGIPLSEKALKNLLKDMDTDGNEEVSLDEFGAWMTANSSRAKALRNALAVESGEMGPAEVAAAEEEEDDGAKSAPTGIFDMGWLESIEGVEDADKEVLEKELEFVGQLFEKVGSKAFEVASNAALGAKKSTVNAEHIVRGVKAHADLQSLFKADSVVINCLMLAAKDKSGNMPLHLAAKAGHQETVRALLDCGADANVPGPDRKCPLSFAAELGHTSIVRLLLDRKAKVDQRDKRKRTPLLMAVRAGRAVEASILLHAGADPNAADDSGNTVTHYAAAFGWLSCIDLLNQAGANMSAPNAMKLTPVTAALKKGHVSVFRRLLSLGIDPNFRDADGSTLLINSITAATRDCYFEVKFLLEQKADAPLASSQGLTPLHVLASVSAATDGLPAYIAQVDEGLKLQMLKGWPERPARPTAGAGGGDEEEDEDDGCFGGMMFRRGFRGKMSKQQRRQMMREAPAEQSAMQELQKKVRGEEKKKLEQLLKTSAGQAEEAVEMAKPTKEKGFHQLSVEEREAVFRLGWTEAEWQKGSNPTTTWEKLNEQQQAAAKLLGLADNWQVIPVQVISDQMTADGSPSMRRAWAVGASEDGQVHVRFEDGRNATVHVCMVAMPDVHQTKAAEALEHVTVAIARLLLDGGAHVNALDPAGETPLMRAMASGYTDLAVHLLQRGADVTMWSVPPAPAKTVMTPPPAAGKAPELLPAKITALHKLSSSRLQLGMTSMMGLLKKMLEAGAPLERAPPSPPDEPRRAVAEAPLHRFVKSDCCDAARLLLVAKADPRAEVGRPSGNVLHCALGKVLQGPFDRKMLDFALELLASHDWGVTLMSEFTDVYPFEAPLRKLMTWLTQSWSGGSNPQWAVQRAEGLLALLKAVPAEVRLDRWANFVAVENHSTYKSSPDLKSPLALACQLNFDASPQIGKEVVQFLLARGLNPNGDFQGQKPVLHELCLRAKGDLSNSPLAEVLLPVTDLSAKIASGQLLPAIADMTPVTPGIEETMRKLLKAKADPNGTTQSNRTSLHLVAQRRQEELVISLLEARANACLKDQWGMTPLHLAVAHAPIGSTASFDIEDLLIKASADLTIRDNLGRTPLHYAFLKGEAAYHYKDPWFTVNALGQTVEWTPKALNIVNVRIDPIQTVDGLCSNLAVLAPDKTLEVMNTKDQEGFTALHLAALRGAAISATKLLAAKGDPDLEVQGNTPLGLAMHRYPETAVALMQRGVNPSGACKLFGGSTKKAASSATESPFALAIGRLAMGDLPDDASAAYLGAAITALDFGYPLAQAFRDAIAAKQYIILMVLLPKDVHGVLTSQRFSKSQNILHLLAASPCTAGGAQQTAYMRLSRRLVDRGVPLAEQDDDGRTPLHLACLNHSLELVKLLLSCGQPDASVINAQDRAGISPLGLTFHGSADQQITLQIAEALIERKASPGDAFVDTLAVKRQTLLMVCMEKCWPTRKAVGSTTLVWPEVLFSNTAPDLAAKDSLGQSCLTYAAKAANVQDSLMYLDCVLHWATRGTSSQQDLTGLRTALLSQDQEGLSPLAVAVKHGRVWFVEHLLSGLAKISKELLKEVLIQQASKDGSTATMIAAQSLKDRGACLSTILRWCEAETATELLSKQNVDGHTALALAVLANNSPVVRILINGRPVAPKPSKVVCPRGVMAGDKVRVRATYTGSSEIGEPCFSVQWSNPPRGGKFEAEQNKPQEVVQADGSSLFIHSSGILAEVDYTLPPGTGPEVEFEVDWTVARMGPGSPGYAGEFLAPGQQPRVPASFPLQDKLGRSLLHLCISPLPFGSFENAEMLRALIQAGVPSNLQDAAGKVPAFYAARQASGIMSAALAAEGVPVPEAADCMDTADDGAAWPETVDVEADMNKAISDADVPMEGGAGPVKVPVDAQFKAPSSTSRTLVADGPDGKPLDLVMTKVDVSKAPYGHNLFYRMQVVHELNQDNFFLFTRWGGIGTIGQFQTSPFESLEKASTEFMKIFRSKTGNDWLSRDSFEKKKLKYQLHAVNYSADKTPEDILKCHRWRLLPPKEPVILEGLHPLLKAASRIDLLYGTLRTQKVKSPLGKLVRNNLDEASALLERIRTLITLVRKERRAPSPDGDRLQVLSEEIAEASSRIYEIIPISDFSHTMMKPIEDERSAMEWSRKIAETDDIAAAGRLLLGCQAKLGALNPIDYIYRAMGIRFRRLKSDSDEMELIETFINRSMPSACSLYDGPRARQAPALSSLPGWKPKWRLLADVRCYGTRECEEPAVALALAGGTVTEYSTHSNGAICIRQSFDTTSTPSRGPLWVLPKSSASHGSVPQLVRLSEREEKSKVSAIYKVDLPKELDRKCAAGSKLLFHGSGMQNMLSILSNGLRVKPPTAMHHGSAFGDGLYFGNSFAKSQPYSALSDSGIGLMLLCQVDVGRALGSRSVGSIQDARRKFILQKLGLEKKLQLSEEEQNKFQAELHHFEEEHPEHNLKGLPYDSYHFECGSHPDPMGNVVHPEGYIVPAGPIIGGSPQDEIIVYETSRVRIRYLLELREETVKIVAAPKEEVAEAKAPGGEEAATQAAETQQDGDAEAEEAEAVAEEEDDEDEPDEEEEEDSEDEED